MKSQKPLSRRENVVVQELEGEVLVYDLGSNKAVCLNETSALIWQACDGKSTPAEISSYISKKLNSPANEDLVWLALDQLKRENLLLNTDELPDHFGGISRRDAIKKVGLSTLIALPVVLAVTSPAAAAAGSFCGPTLNAPCACNLTPGATGQTTPAGTAYCNDVTGTCMGAIACQCFVGPGVMQDPATGFYPGTCMENV